MSARESRPSFLWDYDLTCDDVRRTIDSGSVAERAWLTERILLQASWDEIWQYLTPEQIRDVLPVIKLPSPVKETWERALSLWLAEGSK